LLQADGWWLVLADGWWLLQANGWWLLLLRPAYSWYSFSW